MIILSIDPGPNTGVCIANTVDGSWVTDTLDCYNQKYDQLWEMFRNPQPDHVVCERFVGEKITHWGLETIELVGLCRGLCGFLGIPLTIRAAGSQRTWDIQARQAIKERYKIKGVTSWHEHQIDALAHLLGFQYSLAHPRQTRR